MSGEDEAREDLIEMIWGDERYIESISLEAAADRILAAGYRKVEVTDDMVEKAARAIFDAMRASHPMTVQADYDDPAYDYTRKACVRDARAALEVALGGDE